jgi:cold shock CspA family protein
MSAEYFYLVGQRSATKRPVNPSRNDPRGRPSTGRIARLLFGQCHGFIRLGDRDIFFHRADMRDGTVFNDLQVGDAVAFELLEDALSGARALSVGRQKGVGR